MSRRAGRRRRRGAEPAGRAATGADATAAACGPRWGSKVERFTNSGVVAIFGMPDC